MTAILNQFETLAKQGRLIGGWGAYEASFKLAKEGELAKKVQEFFENLINSSGSMNAIQSRDFTNNMIKLAEEAAKLDAATNTELQRIKGIRDENEQRVQLYQLFRNPGFSQLWAQNLPHLFKDLPESIEEQQKHFDRFRMNEISERINSANNQTVYDLTKRVAALYVNIFSDLLSIARIQSGQGLPPGVSDQAKQDPNKPKVIPMPR